MYDLTVEKFEIINIKRVSVHSCYHQTGRYILVIIEIHKVDDGVSLKKKSNVK